jgi:hypothetical protein
MDKRDLRDKTQEYWRKLDAHNPNQHLEWYIANLLPHEMQWASEHPLDSGQPRLPTRSCDLLVLLVGFSVEPLLQAVWGYKPKKVLLVLNEQYGDPSDNGKRGTDFGNMVKRLIIEHLAPQKPLSATPQVECEIVEAGPVPVFRKLLDKVNTTKDIVVDITGAKKSMVAGAFLYAAYANVDVSYVDFDDDAFDPDKGRPYGYACRIGQLSNPYRAFALRDWERVRELYSRYKFRDARQLLTGEDSEGSPNTIIATMNKYLPDSKAAIKLLAEVLRCYELWDAGLYNEAAKQAQKIDGFQPPTAVTCLGGKWFETRQARFEGGLPDFYKDTPEFQAYVCDELARIGRLIEFNHDYRSAFLRAGSLNEVVMLARLVKLVSHDLQRDELVKALQSQTPGAYSVFDNLKKSVGHTFQIGPTKGNNDICFRDAPKIAVTITEEMDWWRDITLFGGQGSWKQFINRRNDLAHKYFSPPRGWAQDALNFVRANIEDLWRAEIRRTVNTETLHWSELCKLTKLERHLPPNLIINESD